MDKQPIKKGKKSSKKEFTSIIVVGKNGSAYDEFLKKVFKDICPIKIGYVKNQEDYKNVFTYTSQIDLILFTENNVENDSDVNPQYYSENPSKFTTIDKETDTLLDLVYSSIYSKTPKIGIGRSAHYLTVRSGGSIIQHTELLKSERIVDFENGLSIKLANTHHQMMLPYNVKNHMILGNSRYFQSVSYLNGRNEEIDLPRNFLECESVFYKNTNSLCLQSIPHHSINEKELKCYKHYFEKLLNSQLLKNY